MFASPHVNGSCPCGTSGYRGIAVTGRSGPIDHSKGKRMILPPYVEDAPPRKACVGYYFDPDTWDGGDIFAPEGTTHFFVLDRVRKALVRNKIKVEVLFVDPCHLVDHWEI